MEFLETFGCIWSSKEVIKVIIGRAERWERLPGATPASRSDLPFQSDLTRAMRRSRSPFHPGGSRKLTRSDLSERPTEVAPEVRSDLLERHTKVARVLSSGGTKVEHPGATPQSDLPRSLPARATSQSDQLKSLAF